LLLVLSGFASTESLHRDLNPVQGFFCRIRIPDPDLDPGFFVPNNQKNCKIFILQICEGRLSSLQEKPLVFQREHLALQKKFKVYLLLFGGLFGFPEMEFLNNIFSRGFWA
jgi:hypothetical protein